MRRRCAVIVLAAAHLTLLPGAAPAASTVTVVKETAGDPREGTSVATLTIRGDGAANVIGYSREGPLAVVRDATGARPGEGCVADAQDGTAVRCDVGFYYSVSGSLSAGDGDDRIDIRGLYALATVNGGAGDDVVMADGSLIGGPGDDALVGGDGYDVLDGGAGADVMESGPATFHNGDLVDYRVAGPRRSGRPRNGDRRRGAGEGDGLIGIGGVLGGRGDDASPGRRAGLRPPAAVAWPATPLPAPGSSSRSATAAPPSSATTSGVAAAARCGSTPSAGSPDAGRRIRQRARQTFGFCRSGCA